MEEKREALVPPEGIIMEKAFYRDDVQSNSIRLMGWVVEFPNFPALAFATLEQAEDYVGECQEEWLAVARKRQVLSRAPADLARCAKTLERIARALPEGDLREHFTVAAFSCADGVEMMKDHIIDLLKEEVR